MNLPQNFLAFVFLIMMFGSAHAEHDLCSGIRTTGGDDPLPLIATAEVSSAKSFFKNIPSTSCQGPYCQFPDKPYVIKGDHVFLVFGIGVGGKGLSYSCAEYPFNNNRKGRTSVFGWLPMSDLQPMAARKTSASDWVGNWAERTSLIKIIQKDNGLVVSGHSSWQKGNSVRFTGDFSSHASITGNTVTITDGGCKLEAVRDQSWMVVIDNQRCGGRNVSFTGFYRRKH
ncbi:hypothetical protein [Rhizosaccharibacter radicis]|uniref:Uncharacterized protein n=1 Tax=Rhizosaccharibacter radicis TaxID=2782605 RepID=A0ABT1VVF1_9PROT|nr:hypothetical protein [Acetobacteraceae bacterium KSS12]